MQREEENPKAIYLLKRALEISPNYVDALFLLTAFAEGPERDELAERLLTLDPDNPEMKSFVALERAYEGDLAGAARLMEEAAETNPYSSLVLFNSARLAEFCGKTDLAVRLGEYIAVRDPLFFWSQLNLAQYYLKAGRTEDALRQFEVAVSINENAGDVRWKFGLALLTASNPVAALAEFEREEARVYRLHGLVMAYHDLGREEESAAALRELTKTEEEIWPFGMARAHAWIGNADETFRYLEATFELGRLGRFGGLATHPLFQRLYSDPRWPAFLSSVGQSPEQVAAFKFAVEPPE